jgi:hypothetical protein
MRTQREKIVYLIAEKESPKITPKQTLSKRKMVERNIADLHIIHKKIVEIQIGEFFR